jgi:hypothetical protein
VSAAPSYDFRDAGLHSRPLRTLNALGGALRWLGARPPSLDPDALLDACGWSTG